MNYKPKYDQKVPGKQPPTWEDTELDFATDKSFLKSRGGALLPARPVPAAVRHYPADKPIYPVIATGPPHFAVQDGSFVGQQPHWSYKNPVRGSDIVPFTAQTSMSRF